ncbi:DUF192 domain-containing protein [Clostridium thailandense]|uniref:DUF192 domain-containing protein n=1 Tax=Clostridium thailandense TaxID=2794346 RepID=UPI003989D9B8
MLTVLVKQSEMVSDVLVADTFIKRFVRYMFREEPHYEAIIIKNCRCIHTFFMNFPIDVLFINENMEIIKKIENLQPGKIVMPVRHSKMVIQGKAGIFKNFEVGSNIVI